MRRYRNNGPSIVTRIKQMNQWQQTRRHYLITKKVAGQATEAELADLETLQEMARQHADTVAPLDTTKTDKIFEIMKELS